MVDRVEGLLSPLTRAVLETVAEGILVLNDMGRVAYTNGAAREMLRTLGDGEEQDDEVLVRELSQLGGRTAPISLDGSKVCDVIVIPPRRNGEPHTLAERERDAIVETMDATGGKLIETARRLGISRTTLWRRLRAYGIDRARWSRSS
jgi:transcriptional regulator of acetoin/glycerol metabolism